MIEYYQQIANWTGWPPIVMILLLIGGLGAWIYQNRLKIQEDKYSLLENKYEDCQKQTSMVLVSELSETRKKLIEEIEYLYSQKEKDNEKINILENDLKQTNDLLEEQKQASLEQGKDLSNSRQRLVEEIKHLENQREMDNKTIRELEEKLDKTNHLLDLQKQHIDEVQKVLDDSIYPREGKYLKEIEDEILKTIRNQECIYIHVSPFYADSKIDPTSLGKNRPFTLDVVFPGMNHMYLLLSDSLNNNLGRVENPYIGYYYKDYYVTLLHILKFSPHKKVKGDYPPDIEEMITISEASYHGISITNPNIYYIKVPFKLEWLET